MLVSFVVYHRITALLVSNISQMVDPLLSIIIVNWNTCDLLELCIGSVLKHLSGTVKIELIVIDNASADGSAEMIESRYPSAHLIRNRENIGFAKVVNQGALVASGSYLLLLNSDAKLLNDRLDQMLKVLGKERNFTKMEIKKKRRNGEIIDLKNLRDELQ